MNESPAASTVTHGISLGSVMPVRTMLPSASSSIALVPFR
jgi:hypothetical protein